MAAPGLLTVRSAAGDGGAKKGVGFAVGRRIFAVNRGVESGFNDGLESSRPHFEKKISNRFSAGAMGPGAFSDLVEADYLGFDIITHGAARWG